MSCWQVNPLLRPSFNELVKCFLSGATKNFKRRSFHYRGQNINMSDSDDSDDADLLDSSSPLRNSSQNKDGKLNFFRRLFSRFCNSKKRKSASPRKNHNSESPLENHKPPENHNPTGETTSSAHASKNTNHSSNGFVPSENTASTCC